MYIPKLSDILVHIILFIYLKTCMAIRHYYYYYNIYYYCHYY